VYGLVGVGFALIFRATKVLSFAQGAFMLLGAFVLFDLVNKHDVGFFPALVVAVVATAILSAATYFFVFARVAAREAFGTSVATIGLGGVLLAAAAIRYGTSPVQLAGDVVSKRVFHVGPMLIPTADIIMVTVALVLVGLTFLLLQRTAIGLQMRAVADNPPLSVHLGVHAARVSTVAWAIAGGLAAAAGGIYALRSAVDPAGVNTIGLFAFPAIIIGGLDSTGGVFVGGLLLGFLQSFVQLWFGAEWVDIVAFGAMLAVLYVRPSGLFGHAEVVRL
jgi:branched-chain amino acid transport system permease protein